MELSRDSILKAVSEYPDRYDNKTLARFLQVKGPDRRLLRQLLSDMVENGLLDKSKNKTFKKTDDLPGVMVIKILDIDEHGDMIGKPEIWKKQTPAPQIIVKESSSNVRKSSRNRFTVGVGSRALCQIKKIDGLIIGQVIKRLGSGPSKQLGILQQNGRGWLIQPVNKKSRHVYKPVKVPDEAKLNDLVWFQASRRNIKETRLAEITEIIDSTRKGNIATMISLYEHNVPIGFPEDVISQAKALKLPKISKSHIDLRHLDLITIDPDDAKDFDDAITASPTKEGGWDVWVAIADVAAYVTPDSPLDIAARLKGNSVYLPDTVEPMLPHILSSNLCSLKPNEDRACLAVNILFNENGEKVAHRFCRGIMRSIARLTYMQAQESHKKNYGEHTQTVNRAIQNIFGAYASIKNTREKRAPLNIELPERKVHIDKKGNVSGITLKERFDAHKLVEEFMIQANVAAAEALSEKNIASLSRLHEPPKREKLVSLADYLSVLGLKLSAGERATTQKLNELLKKAETKGLSESVGMAVLRSQSQAIYDAENKGHFGLNLSHYTHFTSPIRRYSDLIVHRALIKAFDLGGDGSTKSEISRLKETAEHISNTERRAMAAERDAKDRYIASYLENKVGIIFDARITGVTKFGLFITLDETGADGLIPSRSLGREYFILDEKRKSLIGSDSGKTYKFGRKIKAKLIESTPITGGLIFEMQSKPDKGPIPKIRNFRRDDYSKRKRRKNKK